MAKSIEDYIFPYLARDAFHKRPRVCPHCGKKTKIGGSHGKCPFEIRRNGGCEHPEKHGKEDTLFEFTNVSYEISLSELNRGMEIPGMESIWNRLVDAGVEGIPLETLMGRLQHRRMLRTVVYEAISRFAFITIDQTGHARITHIQHHAFQRRTTPEQRQTLCQAFRELIRKLQ